MPTSWSRANAAPRPAIGTLKGDRDAGGAHISSVRRWRRRRRSADILLTSGSGNTNKRPDTKMEPFRTHTGLVVPLDRPNVDTDQIIPKQFLKRVERTGFGEFLFYNWRFLPDGQPDVSFPLNDARFCKASILIAGKN